MFWRREVGGDMVVEYLRVRDVGNVRGQLGPDGNARCTGGEACFIRSTCSRPAGISSGARELLEIGSVT